MKFEASFTPAVEVAWRLHRRYWGHGYATEAAKAAGTRLPSNHSSLFAPDVDPAMHTAISAEVAMLRDLLKADGG